jgi:peptide-methionine (S)-S-oxide reductase
VPERHYVNGAPLSPPFAAGLEVAQFGMGCSAPSGPSWQIPGVVSTSVGYAGGYTPNPTYEEVRLGRTGHTEVVRVVFDPAVCRYTTLSRGVLAAPRSRRRAGAQGNDIGTQISLGDSLHERCPTRSGISQP